MCLIVLFEKCNHGLFVKPKFHFDCLKESLQFIIVFWKQFQVVRVGKMVYSFSIHYILFFLIQEFAYGNQFETKQ